MTDGQVLYAVLFLVYLADCFCWVGRRSVALVSPWLDRWRPTFGTPPFGNDKGSLLLVNPLLPLGRVIRSHLTAVAIAPEGICAANPQTLPGAERWDRAEDALAFADVSEVAADQSVLKINGRRFARCGGPAQARELAELIGRAAKASAKKREKLVRAYVESQYDAGAARTRLDRAVKVSRPALVVCNLFFVFLFAVAPVLVRFFGLAPLIWPVVGALYGLAAVVSVLFYLAHRSLYPDERGERVLDVVKMMLCPPLAIRAVDMLTADAAGRASPLVVATTLAPEESAAFIRHFVRDLANPLARGTADPLAERIAAWHLATHRELAVAHVERAAPEIAAALFEPPEREGESEVWCPRCLAQFSEDHGTCPDCEGVGLARFAGGPAEAKGEGNG